MLKVTIVEDSADYHTFLEGVFSRSTEFRVHEMYSSAPPALAGIPKNPPDIVLSDIGMPGMGGIELVSRLAIAIPHLKIVMITVFEDDDNVFRALQAGASGYVLKHDAIRDPERFLGTVREVYEGGASMSHTIAQRVLEFFRQSNPLLMSGLTAAKAQTPASATDAAPGLTALTSREHEILSLLAQGFSDKELAEKLFLSVHTVRKHNTNIYEKLQVGTRTEAIARYFKA